MIHHTIDKIRKISRNDHFFITSINFKLRIENIQSLKNLKYSNYLI